MRKVLIGLSLTVLLGGAAAFLTGTVALVETHGNSMAPRITAGDLVVVRTSSNYRVGDVVAYHSADLRQTVLHRLVSVEEGRYTFRGDHNDFDDPEQLTLPQLIGTELVHIPSGGLWIDRLTDPTTLGVLAFGLLVGGAAIDVRRRRKRRAMSQHAASTRSPRWVIGWAPWLRTTVAIAAVTGSIGLGLGAVAWTRPTTTLESDATEQPGRAMTFSYQAEVPPSPAYDGTRVTEPAPIFRRLTDQVDVGYSYRGDPGTVTLAAELSTASGWQSTLPLRKAVTFADTDHTGHVRVDLGQLEARAQAAAEVIGIPADRVDVTVVATIKTTDGHTFAPRLPMSLTASQLTLLGGTPALSVTDTASSQDPVRTDNTLGAAGHQISVRTLRTGSATLALGGLLMLGLVGFVGLAARRTAPNEATVIRRRYATMLLRVEPITSTPGRPVVDVADFQALARLAERYGLLVLHWTRSDVETYIVHDDGISYRYRTGTGPARTNAAIGGAKPGPKRLSQCNWFRTDCESVPSRALRGRGTEESWRLTLQHSPIGMGLVGLDGRILVVNPALCDMLGYEPEQLRSKRFQDITHPDDLPASLTLLKQALAGEIDSLRQRKRYLHADGTVLWVDMSSAPVRLEDGTILHFVTQFLDITEQHASEARLAAANQELDHERRTLEAIFDTVDIGLLLLDQDGSYQRMNRRHAETLLTLQYPDGHQGRAGQPGAVYGPDGRTPLLPEQLPSYRATQGEEFNDVRVWVGSDTANRAAFSVSARRVRDHEGEVTGSVLAYKEITDFMRGLQINEEFVASVSHELRTPLTVVLAHLELLVEDDDLPPRIQPQLQAIERNALRLESLVADLLQVAQAVDGGLELQRTDVDLVALLGETVEAWRPTVDVSGLTLECETPPRLVANVDRQRLRQVVDNLVSNAVRYTGTGGTITLELQGDAHHVRLCVSDTGMGMDETEREHVFSWFVRGDEAARRHISGTGLGLNIVRTIVVAHGGEVTVDSTPGEGSTFHVTLPHGG